MKLFHVLISVLDKDKFLFYFTKYITVEERRIFDHFLSVFAKVFSIVTCTKVDPSQFLQLTTQTALYLLYFAYKTIFWTWTEYCVILAAPTDY